MFGIIESRTKTTILVFLALRGGCSGRQLAHRLHQSTTPVFKALKNLEKNRIIKKEGPPFFYSLNPRHPCYPELISILHKAYEAHPNRYRFLPKIKPDRKVNPVAVYEIAALRDNQAMVPKLSDVLRKRYA